MSRGGHTARIARRVREAGGRADRIGLVEAAAR
jgi:hypothetical protein